MHKYNSQGFKLSRLPPGIVLTYFPNLVVSVRAEFIDDL